MARFRKPLAGAQVNWQHPLARGLRFLNLGDGSGGNLLEPGNQSWKLASGLATRGALADQGSASALTGTFDNLPDSQLWDDLHQAPGYTIALWVGKSASTGRWHFTRDQSSGVTGQSGTGRHWQLREETAGQVDWIPFNDAGGVVVISKSGLSTHDGQAHLVVATVDWSATTGNARLYVDGTRTAGDLGGTHTSGFSTNVVLGGWTAGVTTNYGMIAAWARPFTDQDAAALLADPWGFLAPASPDRWAAPVSGAVTGTGAGSATSSGTATGTRTVLGTGAGAATSSGTAAGTCTRSGTASGTATSSGTCTGTRTVTGTCTGTATSSGTAVCTRTVLGTASGTATSSGTCVVAVAVAVTRTATHREQTTARYRETTLATHQEQTLTRYREN